jgi:type III pantothenate kinase
MRAELGGDARVVATGGLAQLVAPHVTAIEDVDPFLTLRGLQLVWARNR